MIDRRRIVERWRQGDARVLVTLVGAEGSSYRRPGAHLLIGNAGSSAGTISGGCLEAEVVRKAEWLVRAGARMERYSTLFDDTAEIPFGLGCGGVVDLLFEPVGTAEGEAFLLAMESSLAGDTRLVVTWLPGPGRVLARAVFSSDGRVLFASADLTQAELGFAENASVALLSAQVDRSGASIAEGVYVEVLAPPLRLFVLGAGEDAKPVVTLAALLGWHVTVVDGRANLLRAERFPEAHCLLGSNDLAKMKLDRGDAAVLMTHSYEQDRALLAELFSAAQGRRPGYIGVLGARHRSSLLVAEAAELAGRDVAECCAGLHAPVGLDLGGDGPEAIALAIVAEVQAWAQGRPSVSRGLSAEEIAEQIALGGASKYLQARCAVGVSAE